MSSNPELVLVTIDVDEKIVNNEHQIKIACKKSIEKGNLISDLRNSLINNLSGRCVIKNDKPNNCFELDIKIALNSRTRFIVEQALISFIHDSGRITNITWEDYEGNLVVLR
jgi:hypothetical protein